MEEEECKMGTARISLAHNSRVGALQQKILQNVRSSEGKWWAGWGDGGGCGWWWEAWELVLSISNGPYDNLQDELLSKPCF